MNIPNNTPELATPSYTNHRIGKRNNKIHLGIIIGGGSGKILGEIFKHFVETVICNRNQNIDIQWHFNGDFNSIDQLPDENIFGSYSSIKKKGAGQNPFETSLNIKEASKKEAQELTNIYSSWYEKGIKAVFRTSVNAESLYSFRQQVDAVKEILIPAANLDFNVSEQTSPQKKILLFRDQSQGFYTNDDYKISIDEHTGKEEIKFCGSFRQEKIEAILKFIKIRATYYFGNDYNICASYKHHLFGNLIESWFEKIDPEIKLFQPDTGFTKIMDFMRDSGNGSFTSSNLVFLSSNEVGDLLYEPFIEILKSTGGDKLDLYSRSYLTTAPFKGRMNEFQTVHGSIDDLVEKGEIQKIKPYATIRIAAAIIEDTFGIKGFRHEVDRNIARTKTHFAVNSGYSLQKSLKLIYQELSLLKYDKGMLEPINYGEPKTTTRKKAYQGKD